MYDFKTHSRASKSKTLYGANVIVFEGIFAFYDRRITDLMDLKVFVDTDADTRLVRRLRRDIAERGRSLESVLVQYERYVKPSHDDFIQPTVRQADIIIPRGADNKGISFTLPLVSPTCSRLQVAIDLITKHISSQLEERGFNLSALLFFSTYRVASKRVSGSQLARRNYTGKPLPESVIVIRQTDELRVMLYSYVVLQCPADGSCRPFKPLFGTRTHRETISSFMLNDSAPLLLLLLSVPLFDSG